MSSTPSVAREAARRLRSAYRTVRRSIGLQPSKIVSANLGTHAQQCNKFRRFEELYSEYWDYPNHDVRVVLKRLRDHQILYAAALREFLPWTGSEDYKREIRKVINQLNTQSIYGLGYIRSIPDEPRPLRVLSEELSFFTPFMYRYMVENLKSLHDTGRVDNSAFKECVLPPSRYTLPSVRRPVLRTHSESSSGGRSYGHTRRRRGNRRGTRRRRIAWAV